MPSAGGRRSRQFAFILVALVIVVGGGLAVYFATRDSTEHAADGVDDVEATAPEDPAEKAPAAPPPPPVASYLEVVAAKYPALKGVQRLPQKLPLNEAARVVLTGPVYAGPGWRPDLWVTDPGAPPVEEALRLAADEKKDEREFVTRETVVFVHWQPANRGPWTPYAVCRRAAGGGYEVVSPTERQTVAAGKPYRWDRAFSVDRDVVVPAGTGVSVFRFFPELSESFHDLRDPAAQGPAPENEPQVLVDAQGILAWIPWENGKPGGRSAARYADGKWTDLHGTPNWPDRIVQLVPLADGSVVQLALPREAGGAAAGDGAPAVTASLWSPADAAVDEAKVEQLVDQLSHDDPAKRKQAYEELAQYGPGAWPVMERLLPRQPPGAGRQIKVLLRGQVRTVLGGMSLAGKAPTLWTVTRHADGGVIFYAESGVETPHPAGEGPATLHAPAWLSLRPGRPVGLLPAAMVKDLDPKTVRIEPARDSSSWVVTTAGEAPGPQLFVGTMFQRLLRQGEETGFRQFVGVDRRGRWLFRRPEGVTTGEGSATGEVAGPTLILDPTLPDPTPRLPVWEYANAAEVGWDQDDWPAVKFGGQRLRLGQAGWEPLKKEDQMFTRPEDAKAPEAKAAGGAKAAEGEKVAEGAAAPPPADAGTAPSAELGEPLLTDADGHRYFGGLDSLKVLRADGQTVEWPLPDEAKGEGTPTLIRTADGMLFLFNRSGRVLRIRPTPDGAEPFTLEATFVRKIPPAPYTRVWLDPAGRIVIAHGVKLSILFPQGYIPPAIRLLMVEDDVEAQAAAG